MLQKFSIPALLACAALAATIALWKSLGPSSAASPRTWPSEFPAFSLMDQENVVASNSDFRGRVWIADFIFIQCDGTCNALNRKIISLQRQPEFSELLFVSFSIAREDDPPTLKRYAESGYANADLRKWRLLAADEESFPHLAVRMGLTDREQDARDGNLPINTNLYLIDSAGRICGVYKGTDSADLARLKSDAVRLMDCRSTIAETRSHP